MISMNAPAAAREVLAADHDKTKDELPKRPRGPHPYLNEQALAADLAEIYANQHVRVLGIVARTLRPEDRAAYAEDLAQDVWLMVWQYLLRGNEILRPPGLLAVFARRRVYAHYKSARIRREMAVDPQQYGPLDRVCAELAAIGTEDAR